MKYLMIPCLALLAGCSAPRAEIVDSMGIKLRLIPGGTFLMGSETGQPDERPVHRVKLSPYYIGVYEVTQAQYEAVMGENPSTFKGNGLPVENVSWHDAREFCRRLSVMEGATYRLPTEAEWECAARGGSEGAVYVWGDGDLPRLNGVNQANVADESFKESHEKPAKERGYIEGYDDGFPFTAPVGRFPPNGFGLYDMAGNVLEWCEDNYIMGTHYYESSPEVNPKGPPDGEDRVLRGSSWWAAPQRHYRVASRFRDAPGLKVAAVGFRCVRAQGP